MNETDTSAAEYKQPKRTYGFLRFLREQPTARDEELKAAETPRETTETLTDDEKTPEAMLQIAMNHRDLQRDLHRLFLDQVAGRLSRTQLEEMAAPHLAAMNAARQARFKRQADDAEVLEIVPTETKPVDSLFDFIKKTTEEASPLIDSGSLDDAQPLEADKVNERVLQWLIEPDWLSMSPQDISRLPNDVRERVIDLQMTDAKLRQLDNPENADLKTATRERFEKQQATQREVYKFIVDSDRRPKEIAQEMTDVRLRATRMGRPLDKYDKEKLAKLEEELSDARENAEEFLAGVPEQDIDATYAVLERTMRRENWRQLQKGLLMTPDMETHISDLLPSLTAGSPALLVGHTGGAKTALALRMADILAEGKEHDPEFISFDTETNSYKVMGKTGLKRGETVFEPGAIVRAMQRGVPIVIDEVNAAPAEFLKSLNRITQLRPGDSYTINEDSGETIAVGQGFSIIFTMNEKSERYQGVGRLSADLKNRLAATTRRVLYPDAEVVLGNTPPDLMSLATAELTDRHGDFVVDFPPSLLESFVRAAHLTQKLFAGVDLSSQEQLFADANRSAVGKNLLDDTVISPRLMNGLLAKHAAGRGATPLTTILTDYWKSIESGNDRAVVKKIFENYVFTDSDGVMRDLFGKEVSGKNNSTYDSEADEVEEGYR